MTKEELFALIDAKIAGQGTAVDAGGALPAILKAAIGAAMPIEVADITKLTNEQLDSLNVGDKVVKVTGTDKHLYLVLHHTGFYSHKTFLFLCLILHGFLNL